MTQEFVSPVSISTSLSTGALTINTGSTATTGIIVNVPAGGKIMSGSRAGTTYFSIDDWGGISSNGINSVQPWNVRSPGIESQAFFWPANSSRSAAGFGGGGNKPVIYVSSVVNNSNDLTQWVNASNGLLAGVNVLGQIYTGTASITRTTSGSATTSGIIVATGGATTAASGDGTTATITTTTAHGLAVGDLVTVAGVTPTGYNTTALVTAVPSTTQISYANTTTGAQTVAGTVSVPAQMSINALSAGTTGLVLRAAASQSADSLQIQNSDGTVQFAINPPITASTGRIYVRTPGSGGPGLIGTTTSSVYIVAPGGGSVFVGVPGSGSSLQVVVDNTFNRLKIIGKGTGVAPELTVDGNDTNTDLFVYPKGTGVVRISPAATTAAGLVVKGLASQTADLQQWQDSAGNITANVDYRGDIFSRANFYAKGTFVAIGASGTESVFIGSTFNQTSGAIVFNRPVVATNASAIAAIIKGASSQTGDLQQWQNSSGTVLSRIDAFGRLGIATSILASGAGANFSQVSIANLNTVDTNLIVRAFASQAAPLQEWQDSAGMATAYVDSAGRFNGTVLDPALTQYAASGSVIDNLPTKMHPAETLLKQAVWWIDSANSSSSGQTVSNLGWGGSALNLTNGSSTSADSNDAQYLAWDGVNYIYLPGIIGNYVTVPDSASLRITGDIEIVANIALDEYASGADRQIVIKDQDGSNRSFRFFLNGTGIPAVYIFPDGTWTNRKLFTASTNPNFVVGSSYWIKATVKMNNGSGGTDANFYFAPGYGTEPTSWTQLGTTVTVAGTSSIFPGTDYVQIGTRNDGQGDRSVGKFYRIILRNGIDGNAVLDVDPSVITSGSATSFTAITGQTVTINRSSTGRKSVAVVHPLWLFGTDDYMEVNNRWLEHLPASENYVYLNGTSGNYMSSPDSAVLDITGDIDVRVKVALDDWTPSGPCSMIGKWTTGNQSYAFNIEASGVLRLYWSTDGSNVISAPSTVATGIADGAVKWVRATRASASGNILFYTSDDGISWTQLGSTVTAATGNMFSGNAVFEIGSNNLGINGLCKGKFYRTQVYNGINGTLVFDADLSVIPNGAATTFIERSGNAATVTISKSGVGTFASTNNYLYLPGVNGNYATAPDSAALSITGDIDLRCKVALDDWTPAADTTLISKMNGGYSYRLNVNATSGSLSLGTSPDGTTWNIANSSQSPSVFDGTTKWIRATRVASTGLITFFTSDDGANWTQLGTTVTNTAGNIFDGTGVLEIGSWGLGTVNIAGGKFFRAQIFNGINGTLAFDANFESSIATQLPATITESSSNAATVTINYSGTSYRTAGVLASTYVYPGNPNTFRPSTVDFLNFGANDSFTFVTVSRFWGTGGGVPFIAKVSFTGGGQPVGVQITSNRFVLNSDATTNITTGSLLQEAGVLSTVAGVRNRSNTSLIRYINGIAGTSVNDTTTNLSGIGTLRLATVGTTYADVEIMAAAIFRRVLTASEIALLSNYYRGRVG